MKKLITFIFIIYFILNINTNAIDNIKENNVVLNEIKLEEPSKWFFEWGENLPINIFEGGQGGGALLIGGFIVLPDIGIGYKINNNINTSINIGIVYLANKFSISESLFFIENRTKYNFYQNSDFKVYFGVSYGFLKAFKLFERKAKDYHLDIIDINLEKLKNISVNKAKNDTHFNLGLFLGMELTKNIIIEFLYRFTFGEQIYKISALDNYGINNKYKNYHYTIKNPNFATIILKLRW
jgi:hypothetical protein